MAIERVYIVPFLRPVGEVRMIADSFEGDFVGETSSGIVARYIGNADPSVAGRRVSTAFGRRGRGTRWKTDEAALSPTTSIILMVAITVGLAILLYFMVLWTNPGH